jgi:hypothetical protein
VFTWLGLIPRHRAPHDIQRFQPAIDLLNKEGMDIQVFVYGKDAPPLKGDLQITTYWYNPQRFIAPSNSYYTRRQKRNGKSRLVTYNIRCRYICVALRRVGIQGDENFRGCNPDCRRNHGGRRHRPAGHGSQEQNFSITAVTDRPEGLDEKQA